MTRDALAPTEAAKAAWKEFDPGYKAVKGGPDSGDHGHGGETGEVGGSGVEAPPSKDPVYHGTKTSLDAIRRGGLKVSDEDGFLFFANDPTIAQEYGGIVLRFERPPYAQGTHDPRGGQFWTDDPLPPENLQYQAPDGDWRWLIPRTKGGAGSGNARETVPKAPGETPVPEGMVRLYHYTNGPQQLASIKETGITQAHARGEGYGEPSVVWASTRVPQEGKHFVEFYADPKTLDIGAWQPGLTYNGEPYTLADWQAGMHNVTMRGDVPKEHIVAAHEPWHHTYRYMEADAPYFQKDMVENPGLYQTVNQPGDWQDTQRAFDAFKDKYKVGSATGGAGTGIHGRAGGPGEVGGSGTRGDAGGVGGFTLFHHADRTFRESILKGGLQVSRDTTEWEGEPQKVYLTDNPVPATPNTDVWAVDTAGLPVVEHPELLLDIGPEDRPDERWFVSHRDVSPERLRLEGWGQGVTRDALAPTEAAKAAWEELDPGYSHSAKADEMKPLFFAAFAAAEAGEEVALERLEELRRLAREHVAYDTPTTRTSLQRALPRTPHV